jgi:hypothetical protein
MGSVIVVLIQTLHTPLQYQLIQFLHSLILINQVMTVSIHNVLQLNPTVIDVEDALVVLIQVIVVLIIRQQTNRNKIALRF